MNSSLFIVSLSTPMPRTSPLLATLLLMVFPACATHADIEIEDPTSTSSVPEFLPPGERASGFRSDETFEYRVGWGIFGAVARIIVTTDLTTSGGREIFHIASKAKTNGLIRALYPSNTRTDSFLDPERWSVLSSHFEGRTGKEDNKALTIIDYERNLVIHEDDIEPEKSYVHPLPMTPVLDYISAILQMRGLPLAVGKSFPVFVHGGGKFYLVYVDVVDREVKKSAFGRKECFVLEPRMDNPSGIFAKGGGITMWVTDDEYNLPIRVNVHLGFGTASLILDSYEIQGLRMGKKRRR